jgi:hypothetical protein
LIEKTASVPITRVHADWTFWVLDTVWAQGGGDGSWQGGLGGVNASETYTQTGNEVPCSTGIDVVVTVTFADGTTAKGKWGLGAGQHGVPKEQYPTCTF